MIGSIFAAIWYAAVRSRMFGFEYNFPDDWNQVFSWVVSLISLPMGAIFGLIVGILCRILSKHEHSDHFNDYTYWKNADGIRLVEATTIGIKEGGSRIKGKHAYL